MKGRALTTLSEQCHRAWLSEVFHIPRDATLGGIDLADGKVGIELKCRYDRWSPHFTIHAYQRRQFREENVGAKLYWAFLLYGLHTPAEKIRGSDITPYVSQRDCWLLPWSWVGQFPVSHPKTGPYIYVGKKDFPPNGYFIQKNVEGGRLYLPHHEPLLEERLTEEYQQTPF